MSSRRHMILAALGATFLSACSDSDKAQLNHSGPPVASLPKSLTDISVFGFETGNRMAANTVYVFFDPRCPHCAKFWVEAKSPVLSSLKFKWVPATLLGDASLPYASQILGDSNPVDAMNAHEQSFTGKSWPPAKTGAITPELKTQIEANTAMLNKLGAAGVPFLVAKNAKTGELVSNNGGMAAPDVLRWVGLAG